MQDNNFEKVLSNPFGNFSSSITSAEFEEYCLTVLQEWANLDNLKDFTITNNIKLTKNDEEYQIDVYAEYTAINVKFKILIECKHQKRPVERDEVILLNDKIRNLAAHKGILISTSGFQSGALERAKVNGIALLQIMDKRILFYQASLQKIDEYKIEFQKQYPPYVTFEYSGAITDFPDKKIYPSAKMDKELIQKIKKSQNIE